MCFLFAFFLFLLNHLRHLRAERFYTAERCHRCFRFRFHIGYGAEIAALDIRRFHLIGAKRFFERSHNFVGCAMAVRRENVSRRITELGICMKRQVRTFRDHDEDQTARIHAMFQIIKLVEVALSQCGLQTAAQEVGVVEQIKCAIIEIADHVFRIHSHFAKGSFILAGNVIQIAWIDIMNNYSLNLSECKGWFLRKLRKDRMIFFYKQKENRKKERILIK